MTIPFPLKVVICRYQGKSGHIIIPQFHCASGTMSGKAAERQLKLMIQRFSGVKRLVLQGFCKRREVIITHIFGKWNSFYKDCEYLYVKFTAYKRNLFVVSNYKISISETDYLFKVRYRHFYLIPYLSRTEKYRFKFGCTHMDCRSEKFLHPYRRTSAVYISC